MVAYKILATGSQGNAIALFNEMVLVDCGIPFQRLCPSLNKIKLVVLTHIHGDHFNKATVRKIAYERPTVRFGCCKWMVKPLIDAGVNASMIDVYTEDKSYSYGDLKVSPFLLNHDVPNCGYKLQFGNQKVFYATDTVDLNGITAKNYDLYFIESNYNDEDIQRRISEKKENQEYAYEYRVLKTHLSKEKADNFFYQNMGANSEYVYIHSHVDKEVIKDDE